MPRFEPFAGLRFDAERFDLADVTAPPYDVIDDEQRAALAARSPRNIVHVDLPVAEGGRDRYANACHLLHAWMDDGTLVRDDEPSFYVYRMGYHDEQGRAHQTSGVIGALELAESGVGDVLPHEQTTPKARSDRLDMLRACHANLSPVWGLSLAEGLGALCELPGPPLARWTDDDGVHHRLYRIVEPGVIDAIRDAVAGSPVLIADGHHRYETSRVYRDERVAAGVATDADGLTMTFVVELSPEQLHVRAIHRLLSGLPQGFDLLGALAARFEPFETDASDPTALLTRMADAGALALVQPSGAWLLRPRPGAFDGVADLDSSRLSAALAEVPSVEVTYQHGADTVVKRVGAGEAQAAVLLRPATVDQIAATASARTLMPPKTTFFWPKPRTGLVLRTL